MTFAAIFAVPVGGLMIGQWIFFLATKQVPELDTAPASIAFHLAAEFATAVALICGGFAMLAKRHWGREVLPVAIGMLLYTVIASPGYFAQRREWAAVAMFAVLFVVTLVALGRLVKAG